MKIFWIKILVSGDDHHLMAAPCLFLFFFVENFQNPNHYWPLSLIFSKIFFYSFQARVFIIRQMSEDNFPFKEQQEIQFSISVSIASYCRNQMYANFFIVLRAHLISLFVSSSHLRFFFWWMVTTTTTTNIYNGCLYKKKRTEEKNENEISNKAKQKQARTK